MARIRFNPFPVLTTERLILRKSQDKDAPVTFFMRTDARVNKYIERSRPGSIEDCIAFNRKINASADNNEAIVWTLTLKGEDMLIGSVCLWQIVPEQNKAEIGFELHPDHQGKGIMNEALAAVLDYSFNVAELERIEGWAHKENTASIGLMLKHGFDRDMEEEKRMGAEKLGDMIIYSLHKNV